MALPSSAGLGRKLMEALLVVGLVLAPSAAAQGPAPQIDRDSPAGVEYQLPVDRAREQAAGGRAAAGGPRSGAVAEPPLFGVGVKAPSTRARANGTAKKPTQEPGRPAVGRDTPQIVRAQAPPPEGAIGGLAAAAAGGAGVLLAGGVAGLAWRRRARR